MFLSATWWCIMASPFPQWRTKTLWQPGTASPSCAIMYLRSWTMWTRAFLRGPMVRTRQPTMLPLSCIRWANSIQKQIKNWKKDISCITDKKNCPLIEQKLKWVYDVTLQRWIDCASWLLRQNALLPTEWPLFIAVILPIKKNYALPCVCVCVRQLRVVCGRTVRNSLRNPQTSYAQLALNVFFAVLVGIIYYQIPLTMPEALQNRYSTHNLQHKNQQLSVSALFSPLHTLLKWVTFPQGQVTAEIHNEKVFSLLF